MSGIKALAQASPSSIIAARRLGHHGDRFHRCSARRRKGLFEPLPEQIASQRPRRSDHGWLDQSGGKRYGITEKFGYNTIGFNNTKVDPADMQSMNSLLDVKYKGRIAI
jgi:spermidine/putrescine-binding protein